MALPLAAAAPLVDKVDAVDGWPRRGTHLWYASRGAYLAALPGKVQARFG